MPNEHRSFSLAFVYTEAGSEEFYWTLFLYSLIHLVLALYRGIPSYWNDTYCRACLKSFGKR